MDEIKLLKPTMEYADDIMQFRQEIIEANDPDAFAGCGNLDECKTAQEWIDWIAVRENPETCPKGQSNGPCGSVGVDGQCEFGNQECIHARRMRLAECLNDYAPLEECIIPPVEDK